MTLLDDDAPLLRTRRDGAQRVTSMELFFDLVYVFAITQLSQLLLGHLTLRGASQTLLLFLAVWWAWVYTAWFTNWFNPAQRAVRLVLLGVMLASLVMSAALPEAFGDRGLYFAGAYVVMQVGRNVFAAFVQADDQGLRRNLQRVTAWSMLSGVPWLAGGLVHGSPRTGLWVLAVAVDYAAPWFRYATPGLGRSTTADWTIAGDHLAERCQLLLIVALGESILVTGSTFSDLDWSAASTAALVVAFAASVALWWLYFDRSAERGTTVITETDDPGRLGRSAYTFCHLPMVAGIVVTAVGQELTVAHPTGEPHASTALVVLGGPALFLLGHLLFKVAVFERLSLSRLAAIGCLVILLPVALQVAPLVTAAAAAVILALVSVGDLYLYRTAA